MGVLDLAHVDLERAVVDLAGMGHPDSDPKLIGRNIHVMLTPLPPNKRKPKFLVPGEEGDIDDEPEAETSGDNEADDGSTPQG